MAAARAYLPANTSKIGGTWNPSTSFNPDCMVFQPKHIKRKNIQMNTCKINNFHTVVFVKVVGNKLTN